ncbi:MAG: hypothetical protein K2K18_01185, partial [Malacoplasma sp.]|nr:hypothetical protein [Malacoplasma sp.]
MKKINKKKLFTILGLTALGLSSVSVAIPLAANNNQSVVNSDTNSESNYKANENNLYNGAIEFNGKAYKSVDDAAYNYLNNNPITQKKYIGDLSSAYANRDLHTIDLNAGLIREYDVSKISKAYNDESSANGFTDSYEEALKSNLPIYQRIQRYDDYSGNNLNNLPTDFSVAQDNLKRNLATPHSLPYYEVTKLSGEKVKINPLNEKDINRLKDIALENAKNNKNHFAIEDYFSNDGKTYRNIKNFNEYDKNNNNKYSNFEDFLAKTLKTNVFDFLKQIKITPSISTHTDSDEKTWVKNEGIPTYKQRKEFYDLVSFNNNYSFYISKNNKLDSIPKTKDDSGKYVNKITGRQVNLFSEQSENLVISTEAKEIDNIYKGFSNRDELNKNFDYENDNNNSFNWETWHAGSDLILKNNTELYNALKTFFGKEPEDFKFQLKNDTGICFWKEWPSGIDHDYFFYKILEEPADTKSNYWLLKGGSNSVGEYGTEFARRFVFDTYSRQVYFKFQNTLYFEKPNRSEEIKNNTQLIDYFNEHMGISKKNEINENNEVYKKVMQKFVTNYFGVNESYKIDNLKKLPEYNDVISLFKTGYKEIVESLKFDIISKLKISNGGISDITQTFSHYSKGTYVNENDDAIKNTTVEEYTKDLISVLKKIDSTIKNSSTQKQIDNWTNNPKKVIAFNNKPLFLVNSNSKNSSDWTLEQLENVSNRILILEAEENKGYASGMNIGARYLKEHL